MTDRIAGEIIEKCLAKDREDRFDDAESLLGAIEEMTPTGSGESVGGMRWGGRIVAVAVVLVAVAGFSIANLMVGSSDQASNTVGKAGDKQTPPSSRPQPARDPKRRLFLASLLRTLPRIALT